MAASIVCVRCVFIVMSHDMHLKHVKPVKVTGYRRVGVAYVKTLKTLAAFHYVSVSCRTFRVMHLVACMDSFIYKNRHG